MTGRRKLLIGVAIVLLVAVRGWNPFSAYRDTSGVLDEGYSDFESGAHRQPNGVYRVRTLTRMPKVKAKMVRWWFAEYMQTTEHYQRWHPTAHLWMDWENKVPGEIVGASHLVHEYIGDDLNKLRIQFIDPEEILGPIEQRDDQFVLCARVGELEQPLNMATMCHFVRDTPFGAEMRSTFWLGHIAKRDGNQTVFSIEGVLGNTMLARYVVGGDDLALNLMTHAIEEMGTLADFLPDLYAVESQERDKSQAGNAMHKNAEDR